MASQRTDAEAGHQDTGRSTPLFFVSQVLNNSCEPGVMSGCADLTTTPLCRREAGRLGKRLGEVSLVGESAFESDLRQRQRGIGQEVLCADDTLLYELCIGRYPHCICERAHEVVER